MRHPTDTTGADCACFWAWYRYQPDVVQAPKVEAVLALAAVPVEPDLETTPLCFVDVETTGLSKDKDRVIQLAVTRVEPSGLALHYLSYFNGDGAGNAAHFINQISAHTQATAPSFASEAGAICDVLRGSLLVAHNAFSCDDPFMRSEMLRCGASWPCVGTVDTLPVARVLWPGKSHKLGALAELLELETGTAHDAAGDVLTLISLWQRILRKHGDLSLSWLVKSKAARLG